MAHGNWRPSPRRWPRARPPVLHQLRIAPPEQPPSLGARQAAHDAAVLLLQEVDDPRQRERLVVGSIDSVKSRLLSLAKATQADELMITTMAYDHAARRHSYELLADAFALTPVA